jgi:cell division protein FtsW
LRSVGTTLRNSYKNSEAITSSLLLCACALMGAGLVLVYSASFIFASETYGDGLFFFKRQIVYVILGLAAMGAASLVPYTILRKWFWVFFGALIFVLLAVFIPGIGHRAGGAVRWVNLPFGFHLEPGELAKLMSPVIFSFLLTYQRGKNESWWKIWIISVVVVLAPVIIMMKQPDFGSSVIFFLIGFSLLFCFGLSWRYLLGAGIMAIPLFYVFVMRVTYRRQRILAFLNPWADPSNSGFQVIQSLLGIHAGGFWGTGLGKGQAKLFFLPEAHTDFIVAVLGEETGFIGLLFVLILFGWLIFRGLQIAVQCADPFGKRLAIGMSSLIAYQAIINMGVVTGLLPTKGLTMPFLSFGGSSLISVCLACGVLVSIHRTKGGRA